MKLDMADFGFDKMDQEQVLDLWLEPNDELVVDSRMRTPRRRRVTA